MPDDARTLSARELDAQLAERLFKLTVVHDWPCGYSPDCGDYEAALDRANADGGLWNVHPDAVYLLRHANGHVERVPLPRYSEEIAAAMDVVQHITDAGWYWRLLSPFTKAGGADWWAGVTPQGRSGWNGRPDLEAHADSWPEAIARCALLWLDRPKETD